MLTVLLLNETGPTSGGVVTLKTGRREVPGSNPVRVFRVFFRNSRKYGLVSLRKTLHGGLPPIGPGPTSGQLALETTTTTK